MIAAVKQIHWHPPFDLMTIKCEFIDDDESRIEGDRTIKTDEAALIYIITVKFIG